MKFFGFKFSVSGLYSPELCRLLEYPSIQLKALIVSEEPGKRTCGKLFNLRILRLSAFWAKRLKESLDAGNGKTYNDCGNERKLSMVVVCSKATAKAVVWSLQISCRELIKLGRPWEPTSMHH